MSGKDFAAGAIIGGIAGIAIGVFVKEILDDDLGISDDLLDDESEEEN